MKFSRHVWIIGALVVMTFFSSNPIQAQVVALQGPAAKQPPVHPESQLPSLHVFDLPKAAQYLDSANGYTLDQLTDLAIKRSPAMEAARQDIARAEGELRQAGYRPNPTFDFERTRNPVSAPENGYVFGLTLPFELGGKRQRRIEVARLELNIAEKNLADTERVLRAELKSVYGELITAIANLRFTEELFDINQEFFRIVQVRFDEGEGSGLDRNLLMVEINRLQIERVSAHQNVTDFLLQLRQLVRLDQDEPIKVRGVLDTVPISVTREGMLLTASIDRPDLQAARLLEEKSASFVRLQKSSAIPNLNTVFRYSLDNSYFDDFYALTGNGRLGNIRDNDKLLTVGISIELPLFNRNQGAISAATAQGAQSRAQRQLLEQIIRREVQTALSRYESSIRNLSILTQYVLPGAQMNIQTLRGAYEAGQLRLIDVLTEQRKLIEVQNGVRNAQLAVFQAQNDLERAIGRPLQ